MSLHHQRHAAILQSTLGAYTRGTVFAGAHVEPDGTAVLGLIDFTNLIACICDVDAAIVLHHASVLGELPRIGWPLRRIAVDAREDRIRTPSLTLQFDGADGGLRTVMVLPDPHGDSEPAWSFHAHGLRIDVAFASATIILRPVGDEPGPVEHGFRVAGD